MSNLIAVLGGEEHEGGESSLVALLDLLLGLLDGLLDWGLLCFSFRGHVVLGYEKCDGLAGNL